MKMVRGRAQWLFVGSRSGKSERAYFIAPHPTSMPAGQQVDALLGNGMPRFSRWFGGVCMPWVRSTWCEVEVKGSLGV